MSNTAAIVQLLTDNKNDDMYKHKDAFHHLDEDSFYHTRDTVKRLHAGMFYPHMM